MYTRFIPAFSVFFLVAILLAPSSEAQRPLKKLRDRIRENLPEGGLIRKLRDELRDELAGKERDDSAKDDKDKSQGDRQPTPAGNAGDPAASLGEAPGPRSNNPLATTVPNPEVPSRDPNLGVFDFERSDKLSNEYDNEGLAFNRKLEFDVLKSAQLKSGDRIVGVGGLPVNNEEDLAKFTEILKPGDLVELVIRRRNEFGSALVVNGQAPTNIPDRSATAETPAAAPPRTQNITNEYFRSVMEGSSANGSSTPPAAEGNRQLQQQLGQQQQTIEELQEELQRLRAMLEESKNRGSEKVGGGLLIPPALQSPKPASGSPPRGEQEKSEDGNKDSEIPSVFDLLDTHLEKSGARDRN